MRNRTLFAILALSIITTVVTACGGSKSETSSAGKVIKSTTGGNLTVTLSSDTGELKSGENDLTLSFADTSGKPVEVSAASLNFYMPAMGSMAEMNDAANLTTTKTPGVFRARVNIEVAGTWEAQIKYQGQQGAGQATMSVNAK